MALDSVLNLLNRGVTGVTCVQANTGAGSGCYTIGEEGVTGVTPTTPGADSITRVTPCRAAGVTRKAASDKACTHVTRVTPENGKGETAATDAAQTFVRWNVKLINGTETRLVQQPAVTLAELRRRYPGIIQAEGLVP